MEEEEAVIRQAVVTVAGLAVGASVGFVGAGVSSAASPDLHVKPNSIWTFIVKAVPGCEEDQLDVATHTFTADGFADSGIWSGGGTSIAMTWTTGANDGLIFSGHFARTATAVEYRGSVNDANLKAKLVKGPVAGC
jgi:hypothetical protein